MPEQAKYDPIGAHSAQAHTYRYRIPYLPQFFKELAQRCGMTKESEILDLCCGNGQLAIGLSEYVARVDAVDGSAEMLELAPKADNVRYLQSDVNTPQLLSMLSGRKFDCFVVGRAIHWIEEESLRALSEKCLRDDGHIVVAAAGWGRNTPWYEEYGRVWRSFGPIRRVDWRGEGKMSRLGFHVQNRVFVRATTQCDLQYLVNYAASYAHTYQVMRNHLQEFKSKLARALKPYVQDQTLVDRSNVRRRSIGDKPAVFWRHR